ncbi:MAG: PspC domain-containing protein [Candidatus Thorarchaeota archaeon]
MFKITQAITEIGSRMAEIPTPNDFSAPRSGGLYRSRDDRIILGVCGGIAKHYNMDPTLVRVLMFLFTLTVIGILGYIIIGLVIPEEPY